MKKLLEIENSDEYKKSVVIQHIFNILTFTLFLMVRIHDQAFFEFDFYFEFIALFFILRFYRISHRNKNYAFWGYTVITALYILRHVLHFTFVDSNIFILYIGFLAYIFMGLNAYVMSSPLYYPRVQWWEYDFRYRGDLKCSAIKGDESFEARLVDLRREQASILAFDRFQLGDQFKLEVPYGTNIYNIKGTVKTLREDIVGRPVSFGLQLEFDHQADRKEYSELLKLWTMHKKVNIRRKFSQMKAK